jgi:hypothetical protein
MWRLLVFLTNGYWILIPQYLVENLFHARWRDAHTDQGCAGMAREGIVSLFGFNNVPLYVPMESRWNGRRISRLLKQHDIPMWGWGYAFDQFYFRVRREDAWRAQDVLLAAGVDLIG